MEDENEIECNGFYFLNNFDSANLAKVEFVPRKAVAPPEHIKPTKKSSNNNSNNGSKRPKSAAIEFPDFEFNVWTNPDCAGTEYENSNRTWFHFGLRGGTPFCLIKLNIIDLNKQSKMYSQGMAPVFRTTGRQWERIRDRPVFAVENNVFTLSFKFRTSENPKLPTYFAFTYPFSYIDLCNYLNNIDSRMAKPEAHLPKTEIRFNKGLKLCNDVNDALYYHRECVCHSLEGRRVELITISSHHNITAEREPRLKNLFPKENVPRCFRFQDKKVIFISARVHPGETPSSFVFNGLLNLLIQKDDPVALLLRRQFVFKLIPMLNPDGVARGHYRTDTRGVNLNRYYLSPSIDLHPSIFAARSLIRYYHYGAELEDVRPPQNVNFHVHVEAHDCSSEASSDIDSPEVPSYKCQMNNVQNQISDLILTEKTATVMDVDTRRSAEGCNEISISSEEEVKTGGDTLPPVVRPRAQSEAGRSSSRCKGREKLSMERRRSVPEKKDEPEVESGLFLYVDMHGHASKKGIFMYGNHFDKVDDSIECMLLPKIMSINSQNFHFAACNFTEKNMFVRDKRDGTSREGSGRVAVLRTTGLVRSYTLECNYNTGRCVNVLPQCTRDLPTQRGSASLVVPPKYSPFVYEELGRSLAVSILDLTNSNPWSRIPNSEYHTLVGLREWLRVKTLSEGFLYRSAKSGLRLQVPRSAQVQAARQRPASKIIPAGRLAPLLTKPPDHSENTPEDSERKENIRASSAVLSSRVTAKEAGPSQVKRNLGKVGVAAVLQGRRPARPMSAIAKFKQFTTHKSDIPSVEDALTEGDKRVTLSTVSLGLNCDDRGRQSKIPPLDQCIYKQGSKRLKMSKTEGQGESSKLKLPEWSKKEDAAVAGPSTSEQLMVYSRMARPSSGPLAALNTTTDCHMTKKRTIKTRPQLSPIKYKKSLEKRRSGESSGRKKSKTLFKKAGKILLTAGELNKGLGERKRRKN